MRAVVQRVHQAAVTVDGQVVGRIDHGLLVYLGVATSDTAADAKLLAEKIRYLRVFPDSDKPLNRDVAEAGGSVLLISAFTTLADARKGRRPALNQAAEPDVAAALYATCCVELGALGIVVERGQFRAHMDVESVNDGPVCVLVDSRKTF